jgi:hypothetical protein
MEENNSANSAQTPKGEAKRKTTVQVVETLPEGSKAIVISNNYRNVSVPMEQLPELATTLQAIVDKHKAAA